MYDALSTRSRSRLAKEPAGENVPKDGHRCCSSSAIRNVKPRVEVRSKRIGGANYQVPMQVNRAAPAVRSTFRWIIDGLPGQGEGSSPMHMRLGGRAVGWRLNGEGKAMADARADTHRMAEANKAFAHFAR